MLARSLAILELAAPIAAALLLLLSLAGVWVERIPYPYDLEWMEGGMLAHSWRLLQGLPLYVEPNPEFVPYVYPPGYAAVVAVLGAVVGLSPALGRVVSLLGVLAAAVAIAFIVQRQSQRDASGQPDVNARVLSLVAAAAFLGTYPATGAFFDLVRPDGLFIGLLAWSVALGLEPDRRAVTASGVLLCLAFLMKHNAAAFGPAMALGIALRSGVREALRFVAAALIPALLAVAWLQWRSDGLFLTYLVDVPRSHPSFFARVWPGTLQELGTPLPVALALISVAFLWLGMHGQKSLPLPATTFGPVGAGVLVGALGTWMPPDPASGLLNVPSATAFFALGAVPVAFLLYAVGAIADRKAGRADGAIVSWRFVYGMGVALTALVTSAAMRAHNGGFLNVHIQLFWVVCIGFGVVLERMISAFPSVGVRVAVCVAATAQLQWALGRLDERRLTPTADDVAYGDRLVEAAREAPGEVLSPFAAWIPVYAGKPPSLHYMGLWDLEYKGGPFYDRRDPIEQAVRERRWGLVLGGNKKFGYRLTEHYETVETLVEDKSPLFMPKTGWRARPNRLMQPR